MVHPETNSLLVLYDDAQSINRRKARLGFSFADVGIQARGRTTILRMNYRNTAQIMAVACEFARDLLYLLHLPARRRDWPDRERLALRFDESRGYE